jgi:cytochrome c nitrite reductase small subunit
LLGIPLGLGTFTFLYAEGGSYLSTDPRACVNCHIMRSEFEGWQKASHHGVATCVDCHLPHDFVGKYLAKARNGWNHSKAFTLQDFPEPIRISAPNAAILEASCRGCHAELVHGLVAGGGDPAREIACVHCHATVGHGDAVGLGGPWRPGELEEGS